MAQVRATSARSGRGESAGRERAVRTKQSRLDAEGSTESLERRIDRLALPHTVSAYNPSLQSSKPASPGRQRVWQLRNYTMEQIQQLVPSLIGCLTRPEPARSAYQYFDSDKRPTLDNDKLYAEARRDPRRPKLATMQKRAIDVLWENASAEEREQYEAMATKDTVRHISEATEYDKQLLALQSEAAQAELVQFLDSCGLGKWCELIRSKYPGVDSMRSALHRGRWTFTGNLEDFGMNETERKCLLDAIAKMAVAQSAPAPETEALRAERRRRKAEEAAEKERQRQAELKQKLAEEETERAAEKARKANKRAEQQRKIAERRLLLDDHGNEVDLDLVEQILARRTGTGEMEGHEEFLVRWEFGAGMVSREKLPLDRSWVAGELLGSINECALLITEFFNEKSREKTIGEETSIHFNSMRDPQAALARKRNKIVSAEASKLWDSYRAPFQLPAGAPKGLKPRDFLRVHRCLDQHGDGFIRPADVRTMCTRLGLHLSVDETAEIVWEVDDDHTGALDVQDLVELYFRVCTDATGCEPRRLFNVVEFLLFSAPSEPEARDPTAKEMTQEEREAARAAAYTLEAEEATRMARNRYNGRENVPTYVNRYLERMDVQDMSINFVQFLHSPLALVPPNWVDRVTI